MIHLAKDRQEFFAKGDTSWKHLLEVARLTDPDVWRCRLRSSLASEDWRALEELSRSPEVASLPAASVVLLADALWASGANAGAVSLLREAQDRFPADFWVNYTLGWMLTRSNPRRPEEALRFLTAAVAIHPDAPAAHHVLGWAFWYSGRTHEAITCYQAVVRIQSQYQPVYYDLGLALTKVGRHDEAVACFKEMIRYAPDSIWGHTGLSTVFAAKGQPGEAVAWARKALGFAPRWAHGHCSLGDALRAKGELAEAIRSYQDALGFDPDFVPANCHLSLLLANAPEVKYRDVPRAVELAEKAVRLAPDVGQGWRSLGVARYRAGDHKEAVAALMKAVDLLHGGEAIDWLFLAMAHGRLGDTAQARAWYDKAVAVMDKDKSCDEEVKRACAEAAALLGVEERTAKGRDSPPVKK